jgi:dihydropteroate synthase
VPDPARRHDPRLIAGTLDGFAGFRRFHGFHGGLVDPLRSLLPLAVELDAVTADLAMALHLKLSPLGFFVDDRDLKHGKLRIAGPLERFEVAVDLLLGAPAEVVDVVRAASQAALAALRDDFDLALPGGRRLPLPRRPRILAVLNVTPDSFSDGGRFAAPDRAIERAFELIEEGADLLDVGAESTRPGARPVPADEEWARLEPVLRVLGRESKVPIAVDTMKAEVAERALALGASIVNDVSGLEFDPRLADVAARHHAGLVVNHMQGTPRTMQQAPRYDDAVAQISRSLRERVARARDAGVAEDALLLDPGIGFGKRLEDNLDVLARLPELRSLGRPLLIGCSRKSFLGTITGRGTGEREFATAATSALAMLRGVKMIRVHDVAATRDVLAVLEAVDARELA